VQTNHDLHQIETDTRSHDSGNIAAVTRASEDVCDTILRDAYSLIPRTATATDGIRLATLENPHLFWKTRSRFGHQPAGTKRDLENKLLGPVGWIAAAALPACRRARRRHERTNVFPYFIVVFDTVAAFRHRYLGPALFLLGAALLVGLHVLGIKLEPFFPWAGWFARLLS
jgi:hypothetical protein